MLPVNAPDAGDVGAVYIDSNGTKLRILSKFNDAPSVSKVEDLGPRKPPKGGKGTKFLPSKKKKRRGNKHHKYLKLATQSKKNFSHKSHSTQVHHSLLSVYKYFSPFFLSYFCISSLTAFIHFRD